MARRTASRLDINVTSAAEEQMAKFVRGLTPWIVWLLGMPAAVIVFSLLAKAVSNPHLVSEALGAAAAAISYLVWRVTHSRGIGRIHHALNALGSLGWVAAVIRFGWFGLHGYLLIGYAVGGLVMTLAWNVRYSVHTDGPEDITDVPKRKGKAVNGGYLVRVLAGRFPGIRRHAERGAKVIPALNAPWRADNAAHAAAITPGASSVVSVRDENRAKDQARAVTHNFRDLAATKAKDLSGARIKVLSAQPWRIRTEVALVRGVQTPKAVEAARELLASQCALPLSSVLVKPNPSRHDRVFVDFVLKNTLAESVPWPGPHAIGKSIAEAPIRFGIYEDRTFAERFGPAIGADLSKRLRRPEKNLSHLLSEGMNGSGKALALDTLVPTPSGWTTMGDIAVGDLVFDETGEPCTVTDAWPVRVDRPCYEIRFSDGSLIVADEDHQWFAHTSRSRLADSNRKAKLRRRSGTGTPRPPQRTQWPAVFTTGQMARSLYGRNDRFLNYSVHVTQPLNCPLADLPIGPYTLGAWLGDGTSSTGTVTTMDAEIVHEIENDGYVVIARAKKGRACTYRVVGLTTLLKSDGLLNNKHIPVRYLRASEDQRRALLGGLLDTDGYCTRQGTAEYCSTSERLAHDVLHLVSTLGYKPSIRSKTATYYGKDCGTVWTVTFATPDKVFRLPRKASRQITTERATAVHRYVTAINPVPSVPVRCVAVDSPNSLFLVGQACIATHNSSAARIFIADGATRLDVVEWVIDTVKQAQTFGRLAEAINWFATSPAEARALIRFLADLIIPARADYLGNRGYDNWESGCGLPYLRVTVEEGGIIANELDKLDAVLNSARSTGVEIDLSAQRVHHALVDTNVRAAFGDTLSFGAKNLDDVFAMPDDMRESGADPSLWANKQPGMCYYGAADLDLDRQLMQARTFAAPLDDLAAVITEYAPLRDGWIRDNCPDWERLLRQIDRAGLYAKRTTGADVAARMSSAVSRRTAPKVVQATVEQPAEPSPVPDYPPDLDEEKPVSMDELDLDGEDREMAAATREDARIDPKQPLPAEPADQQVDFGRPRPQEMDRDGALGLLRGFLMRHGDGWEFAPRDLYEEVCTATGRSAGWVRNELATTLVAEGMLRHDRSEGRYSVDLQVRSGSV